MRGSTLTSTDCIFGGFVDCRWLGGSLELLISSGHRLLLLGNFSPMKNSFSAKKAVITMKIVRLNYEIN